MTATFDPLRSLRTLVEAGVEFIVIGQMAAVIHGHPETTVDLDVVPRQDVDNVERLVEAGTSLHAVVVDARGQSTERPLDERDLLGWTGVVELDTDAGPLDIVPVAIGAGAYDDLRRSAVEVDLDGTTVLVASLADVIASKAAAGRPKDLARLPSLRAFAARQEEPPR